MSARVLIVEDDPALIEVLQYNLQSEGFETAIAMDGEAGLAAIDEEEPDLIIMDWMLPNLSGVEACRRIRRRQVGSELPVIMLTAKGEERDRVQGLESGADDYMVKPFSPSELIARVRAVLRRANPGLTATRLEYEDIVMDTETHKVTRDGQSIKLGPTEFRMLRVFIEKPGKVYSREQLLDKVWGRDVYVEERTVDVHIRRLRKALNETGGRDLIRTVRSAGYSLDSDTE